LSHIFEAAIPKKNVNQNQAMLHGDRITEGHEDTLVSLAPPATLNLARSLSAEIGKRAGTGLD